MDLSEQYHTWHSPVTGKQFEMLVFGHGGYPVVLFPTSQGSYYQAKDTGLIESARWFIEHGKVTIYCPDSMDAQSWYNRYAHPSERAINQGLYDRLIQEEVVGRARHETGHARIAVAGCSFGGYHAVNFAFRHPQLVSYCFSMSGIFDIRSFTDGYYDDNVYFNNPVDYIPQSSDPALWQMGLALGVADRDVCLADNERLHHILGAKNLQHWFDIRPDRTHDWPVWKEMFPHYLSLLPQD